MAFHSALPKDGGLGAVYVLLKRNRERMNRAITSNTLLALKQ
ncbi:hypothetical protein PGH43_02935 [Legionella pneumophila 130b]|nr:hypothetical protein PGH43_02935 [Legionella pneumophila 130b]